MKHIFIAKALIVSMTLAASMWIGTARAEEFKTLAGIQAEAISSNEMAAVEGKAATLPGLEGLGGLLIIPLGPGSDPLDILNLLGGNGLNGLLLIPLGGNTTGGLLDLGNLLNLGGGPTTGGLGLHLNLLGIAL